MYHGYGELVTDFSVYKGFFSEGFRNGKGEEQFRSGLTIEGEFIKNRFTNTPNEQNNTIVSSGNKSATIDGIQSSKG